MSKLFGIPVGHARDRPGRRPGGRARAVAAFALRNRVFFSSALRNIRRRRGPQRADRRRADARDDDHRLRAGDRRHDEPRRSARRRSSRSARPTRSSAAKGDRLGARRPRGRRHRRRATSRTSYADRDRDAPRRLRAWSTASRRRSSSRSPCRTSRSRQNEPRVTLFASDPADARASATIRAGRPHRLARRPAAGRGLPEREGGGRSSTRTAGDRSASSPAARWRRRA